jgi:predicted MPP superfamily phosphohydrolase
MPGVLARQPLSARLEVRLQIEQEAIRTGKSMRRHPDREIAERLVLKPLLKALLMSTGLYALGVRNALRPELRRLTLHFRKLPPVFDGYRVLHLSDLHIDAIDGLSTVVAERLKGLEADVCLMTGDYRCEIEGSCEKAWAGMREVLASISATDGVFATLGNHDPCEMAPALEAMGVDMVINEALELHRGADSIWIAGIDDSYDYRCDDLGRALEPIPEGEFNILMAHTPDLFEPAYEAGVDLYLCGHTHAGQVRLPWIGSVVQNSSAPRAYTHGYWNHDGMHGYTSAGIGCSMLPIRFNCPPEIVLIELRRA